MLYSDTCQIEQGFISVFRPALCIQLDRSHLVYLLVLPVFDAHLCLGRLLAPAAPHLNRDDLVVLDRFMINSTEVLVYLQNRLELTIAENETKWQAARSRIQVDILWWVYYVSDKKKRLVECKLTHENAKILQSKTLNVFHTRNALTWSSPYACGDSLYSSLLQIQ